MTDNREEGEMRNACRQFSIIIMIFIGIIITSCSYHTGQGNVKSTALQSSYPSVQIITLTINPVGETPASSTPIPSPTPVPSKQPTFDEAQIHTATPAPSANCPLSKPLLKFDLPRYEINDLASRESWSRLDQIILAYLNQGGTIQNLALTYQENGTLLANIRGFVPLSVDITNDNVPEIIVVNPLSQSDKNAYALYIFGCFAGSYQTIFTWQDYGTIPRNQTITIADINADNVPELILQQTHDDPRDLLSRIYIWEWNGKSFGGLLHIPYDLSRSIIYRRGSIAGLLPQYKDYISGIGLLTFMFDDINQNELKELLVKAPGIAYSDGPSRDPTIIYAWNGIHYEFYRTLYTEPEYRFQAVQDGDDAARFHEYDKALEYYEEVIQNKQLLWYSPDRQLYFVKPWYRLTPVPNDLEDPTEYPRLAAYVTYRILLIDVLQGNQEPALGEYQKMEIQYPVGNPGNPYYILATKFWVTYQNTGNIGDACEAAITYAEMYPDILKVLGSEYHGHQSQIYIPDDVCPFK